MSERKTLRTFMAAMVPPAGYALVKRALRISEKSALVGRRVRRTATPAFGAG